MTQIEGPGNWSRFYQANAGRAPRPLFTEALQHTAPPSAPGLWAADIGCGDGTETLALLEAGWRVLAIDQEEEALALVRAKVPPALLPHVQMQAASFEDARLPPAAFVYAGFALPFCAPARFAGMWGGIVAALAPGGLFAGQLFGVHDSWVVRPGMTFHTRADVDALLEPFEVLALREVEEDGQAVSGPKHWHVFHIIARKQ